MPVVEGDLHSSALSGYRYDTTSRMLILRFVAGGSYAYRGVPQDVFDGLRDASSAGSFFNRAIKGVYD